MKLTIFKPPSENPVIIACGQTQAEVNQVITHFSEVMLLDNSHFVFKVEPEASDEVPTRP